MFTVCFRTLRLGQPTASSSSVSSQHSKGRCRSRTSVSQEENHIRLLTQFSRHWTVVPRFFTGPDERLTALGVRPRNKLGVPLERVPAEIGRTAPSFVDLRFSPHHRRHRLLQQEHPCCDPAAHSHWTTVVQATRPWVQCDPNILMVQRVQTRRSCTVIPEEETCFGATNQTGRLSKCGCVLVGQVAVVAGVRWCS